MNLKQLMNQLSGDSDTYLLILGTCSSMVCLRIICDFLAVQNSIWSLCPSHVQHLEVNEMMTSTDFSVKRNVEKLETWKSLNIIKQKLKNMDWESPGLQVTFIEEVSQTAQNWKTSGSNVELASKIQNWLLQRQKETHCLVTWFLQIYLWGVSILHQQSFLIFHIHLALCPGLSPSLLLTSILSLVAYINPSTQ